MVCKIVLVSWACFEEMGSQDALVGNIKIYYYAFGNTQLINHRPGYPVTGGSKNY
ncbi:MAG: hypothetical protein Q7U53_11215 [Anaerolineaceae bacterium]|nr:hypothetical protein [Anaerolineaceae bacterium]